MRYEISYHIPAQILTEIGVTRSSDEVVFGQMTRGQSTDMKLQIGDCQCQEGMAELRGQKGPGNGLKRGTKKPEMR